MWTVTRSPSPASATVDGTCPVWGPGYEGGLFPGCVPTPILQLSTGTVGALVK